jgi:hypothetical protein
MRRTEHRRSEQADDEREWEEAFAGAVHVVPFETEGSRSHVRAVSTAAKSSVPAPRPLALRDDRNAPPGNTLTESCN